MCNLSLDGGSPLLVTIGATLRKFLSEHRATTDRVSDGPDHWAVIGKDPRNLRAVIGLPTKGCRYARTKWAGCAICGHSSSTLWNPNIKADQIISDFEHSLDRIRSYLPRTICLYTSGSFLDIQELPYVAQQHILKTIDAISSVSEIVIESLPNYISENTLHSITNACPSKMIQIGMGLDSAVDNVRQHFFQRHTTRIQYQSAIKTAKLFGIMTAAYVVHKHPFLEDGEAVAETTATLNFAYSAGFNRVSIEPVAIQAGTLQAAMAEVGLYEAPNIWTIVAAIRACKDLQTLSATELQVGGQLFTPLPYVTISGCDDCVRLAQTLLPGSLHEIFNDMPRSPVGHSCCNMRSITKSEFNLDTIAKRAIETLDKLLLKESKNAYH